VLLALLLGLGVQDKEIARILKISAESVRLWRLKFKAQEEINKGAVIG
jgi:transposase